MASQLFRAITSGDVAELEDALDELELDGLSPDCFDTPHNEQQCITPLLAAVSSQNASSVAMAEALLERGASLEQRSAVGSSALHFAVRGGSSACVAMLLRRDPALALVPNKAGDLPLFFALSEGFLKIGALLLGGDRAAAEAQACRANNAGTTAVMIAARSIGDLGADARARCAELVHLGADVGAVDSAGRTALHYAASAGSPAWVRALLEFGADATAKMHRGARTPLTLARELTAKAAAATATAGEFAARSAVVEALAAAEALALKAREASARAMTEQLLAEEEIALKTRASSAARSAKKKKKKKKQKKRQQQQLLLSPPAEASSDASNRAAESSSSDGGSPSTARAARASVAPTRAAAQRSRPLAVPADADDSRPGEWSVAAAARRRKPSPTAKAAAAARGKGGAGERSAERIARPSVPMRARAAAPAATRVPPRQRGASTATAAGRTAAAPSLQRGWGAPAPPRSSGAQLSIAGSVGAASPAARLSPLVSDLAAANSQLFARHPLLSALDLDCRHVCGAAPAAGALSLSQIEALVDVHKRQLHALLDARVAIEEQQHLVASLERRRIEAEYSAIASLKGQGARATSF